MIKKFLKYLGIIVLIAALALTALYFTVPAVKDWTNTNIFHIEQTVEDDASDDTTTDEDNTVVTPDGDDSSILPEDDLEQTDPVENTENTEE